MHSSPDSPRGRSWMFLLVRPGPAFRSFKKSVGFLAFFVLSLAIITNGWALIHPLIFIALPLPAELQWETSDLVGSWKLNGAEGEGMGSAQSTVG